jgi:hypothetical protein
MRSDRRLKEELRLAGPAKINARVYDFCTSFEQIRRQSRLNDLRYENELLARALSEARTEVARLRRVLAE